jgi:hypothetical protein
VATSFSAWLSKQPEKRVISELFSTIVNSFKAILICLPRRIGAAGDSTCGDARIKE